MIDIETGNFELADDIMTATHKFLDRCPDSQTWVVIIGHQAVHRFGSRSLKETL
jgi:hypothetical protein